MSRNDVSKVDVLRVDGDWCEENDREEVLRGSGIEGACVQRLCALGNICGLDVDMSRNDVSKLDVSKLDGDWCDENGREEDLHRSDMESVRVPGFCMLGNISGFDVGVSKVENVEYDRIGSEEVVRGPAMEVVCVQEFCALGTLCGFDAGAARVDGGWYDGISAEEVDHMLDICGIDDRSEECCNTRSCVAWVLLGGGMVGGCALGSFSFGADSTPPEADAS
jgi:hypothetical protein